MKVVNIAVRRKCLYAVTFDPPPPEGLEGAEYEGQNILVDKTILARCDIKKGAELNLDELKSLCLVSESYRAKNKAIWYLSRTDYSEKFLYDKLRRTFSQKAAAFAVQQMVNKGYVDDERYAKAQISKLLAKNASVNEIRQKLYLKGVSKDVLDPLLKDEEVANGNYDRLLSLIKSRYINKIEDEEDRRKTVQALRRKGFSFSEINKALGSFNCSEEIF